MPGGQLPPWFVSFIQWAGPIVQIVFWVSIPLILFMAYLLLRRVAYYYLPEEEYEEEEYEEMEEESGGKKEGRTAKDQAKEDG